MLKKSFEETISERFLAEVGLSNPFAAQNVSDLREIGVLLYPESRLLYLNSGSSTVSLLPCRSLLDDVVSLKLSSSLQFHLMCAFLSFDLSLCNLTSSFKT